MTVLIAGDGLSDVATAVEREYGVERAETLEAVREALPDCVAVVVADLVDAPAAAVRETVRSGVYCPPETPVLRLAADGEADDGYDAVVPRDDHETLLAELDVVERATAYRDAVEALYEACSEDAQGEDVPDLDAAFRRAEEAFEELHEGSDRTPYGLLFGTDEGHPDADGEAEGDSANGTGDNR